MPSDTSTAAQLTGGGTYRSDLDTPSDADWWQVSLVDGLTYGFKGALDSGERGFALDIRDAQGRVTNRGASGERGLLQSLLTLRDDSARP